jgi:hypothetical protein
MLQNIKELYGYKLAGSDGDVGQVKDFYFDDKNWVIRYLVADTGSWLQGRLVLLSPHAFGELDGYEKTLHINLRKKQIEESPSIEMHKPVSRQYEVEYYRYYGWPAYWNGGAMWGMGGYPVMLPPSQDEMAAHLCHHRDDKHLRSTLAVTGYHIHAVDGVIGHVTGFLVEPRSWAIGKMVVEAGHWYYGREILISPDKIDRISYEDSSVFVNLTKADIQGTAEFEVARAGSQNPVTYNFTD